MAIEAPLPMDEPWIRQLLILCDLPQEDITPEHLRHFLVLKKKGQVIGLVGVEALGQFGLLRFSGGRSEISLPWVCISVGRKGRRIRSFPQNRNFVLADDDSRRVLRQTGLSESGKKFCAIPSSCDD